MESELIELQMKWNVIEYIWDDSIVYEYDNTMKMKWLYDTKLNWIEDDTNVNDINVNVKIEINWT